MKRAGVRLGTALFLAGIVMAGAAFAAEPEVHPTLVVRNFLGRVSKGDTEGAHALAVVKSRGPGFAEIQASLPPYDWSGVLRLVDESQVRAFAEYRGKVVWHVGRAVVKDGEAQVTVRAQVPDLWDHLAREGGQGGFENLKSYPRYRAAVETALEPMMRLFERSFGGGRPTEVEARTVGLRSQRDMAAAAGLLLMEEGRQPLKSLAVEYAVVLQVEEGEWRVAGVRSGLTDALAAHERRALREVSTLLQGRK